MFFPILFRRLMNRLSCASTQYSTQFLFTHPPPCGSFPPALSFSYWVLTSLEVLTHPHGVFSCLYTIFLSIVLVFVFCVPSRAIPYQGVPLMAGCPRFRSEQVVSQIQCLKKWPVSQSDISCDRSSHIPCLTQNRVIPNWIMNCKGHRCLSVKFSLHIVNKVS